jgi:hypothetical protein
MAVQSGMSVQETQETMTAYLEDLLGGGRYARHFAEDSVVALLWTDQVVHGPAAAEQLIDHMHRVAFAATPVLKTLCIGAGHALAEFEFMARHIGEFAGIAATGKEVHLPYAAAYDLADGKITVLRLYFPLEQLVRELRAN